MANLQQCAVVNGGFDLFVLQGRQSFGGYLQHVASTSRTLKALGLSSLKALDPAPLVVRCERAAPGELQARPSA